MKKLINLAIDTFNNVWGLLQCYHITAYATQGAYFMLLSGIPIVMLVVIFVGAVMPLDMAQANVYMQQFIPEAIQSFAARFIDEIFNRSNIPLASITTIFLMWSASTGVRSIGSGIQNIFGNVKDNDYIKTMLYSFLYTIIFIITIIFSLVILVFASPLEMLLESFLPGRVSIIFTLINFRNIIFFFALTFLFMLAYKSLAKSSITFLQQLPGAAFAALGWILFSFGFSIYISYFSTYTYFYGSFGAAMLFMLWLYMCMNILLVGALINKLRLENTKK